MEHAVNMSTETKTFGIVKSNESAYLEVFLVLG